MLTGTKQTETKFVNWFHTDEKTCLLHLAFIYNNIYQTVDRGGLRAVSEEISLQKLHHVVNELKNTPIHVSVKTSFTGWP
jgi:hypothetical protein